MLMALIASGVNIRLARTLAVTSEGCFHISAVAVTQTTIQYFTIELKAYYNKVTLQMCI